MLEHADGYDAVEPASYVAIILQFETGMIAQPGFKCALIGNRKLLFRERYAGDISAGDPREVETETAPAAADVEHALAWLDRQFGRYVTPFGKLRVLERLPVMFEIGAGILPVLVEEERVEIVADIVMLLDIAAGAFWIVALL